MLADEPQAQPIYKEARRDPRNRPYGELPPVSEAAEEGDQKLCEPHLEQELPERLPNEGVWNIQGTRWTHGVERLAQTGRG